MSDAPMTIHDRVAWIAYAVIFLVIPLVVLVWREHLQTWHYYLAAGLILVGALLIEAMNVAHTPEPDEADSTAQR
ncbi:MAG TPA: hypothetical protein VFU71_13405 [Burkholderiaceae bacterium]|nr:hypothetical protein [Burkholderiaceae bacterium]